MHSRRQLTAELRSLGIARGDVVMAHASVRAIGEVAGGPDEIHLAIKDAITPEGTLLMYAGCPRYVDEIGRGNLSPAQEIELRDKLPPFDPATARSARDHGILVEFLRTYPGSRVNAHVARFVAWGKHTDHLFSSHSGLLVPSWSVWPPTPLPPTGCRSCLTVVRNTPCAEPSH